MADLTCRELVELATDYMEAMLSPLERDRFEEHLSRCEGCRHDLEQMRQTIAPTGQLTVQDVPPEIAKNHSSLFAIERTALLSPWAPR